MDALRKFYNNFPDPGVVEFPNLPPLTDEEASEIINAMSTGKANAFDLFSDVIFNGTHTEKVKNLIKTLWTKENLNMLNSSHFLARLIPRKTRNIQKLQHLKKSDQLSSCLPWISF